MEQVSRRSFLSASTALAASAVAFPACLGLAQPARTAAPATEGDAHRGPCVIASVNGLRATVRASELIRAGYDPADAIVQGVKIIEDDPEDDSVGIGGLPNAEGVVELDASVMHGPTHKSGAVASLRDIKNPASVALMVLRRTDHCLLVGEGARRYALSMGFREENLLTEKARREWMKWRENLSKDDDWLNDDERDAPSGKTWDSLPWQDPAKGIDDRGGGQNDGDKPKKAAAGRPYVMEVTGTVHVSAVTPGGDVASCTSTSGLNWKIPGRVGDSPIVGAGNYCDNAIGAGGCTGRGEAAIVNLAAFQIVENMARGMTPAESCMAVAQRVVEHTKEKRLRGPDGRVNFNVRFYALRKDGAYGCATIQPGHKFAVCDAAGAREVEAPSVYATKSTP